MATVRLMSANNLAKSQTVNSRTYTVAAGAEIDVPDFDAWVLLADGWVNAAPGATSGATALRPVNPAKNTTFHDTTLGYTIVYDGKSWRNPATGAIV